MSEQPPRSPLISLALSLAESVKCCSSNSSTSTETTISGNTGNTIGDPTQTVSTLQRNASGMSADLTTISEEPQPAQVA
jgi:hypothetical protein